jgi:hypothetical protein
MRISDRQLVWTTVVFGVLDIVLLVTAQVIESDSLLMVGLVVFWLSLVWLAIVGCGCVELGPPPPDYVRL